jgi:hypothetical protein
MASRQEIFDAIKQERDYQLRRWGTRKLSGFQDADHSVTEFATFVRDYAEEACHRESREVNGAGLEALFKAMVLCFACFEQHELWQRDYSAPCINGRDGQPA